MENVLIKEKENIAMDMERKLEPEMELEKSSIVRKILNFIFTRILLYLPFDWGTKFFVKSCKGAAELRSWATTWRALEILYNWDPEGNNWKSDFELGKEYGDGFFTRLWQNLENSKAVRNRYKILKMELKKEIRKKVKKDSIILVSLGCGSGRLVLETIKEIREEFPEIIVKSILIDYSRSAVNFAKKLADNLEVNHVEIERGDVRKLRKILKKKYIKEADIIECNGVLPYFPEIEAVNFLEEICQSLNPGGVAIISNTGENFETEFIKKIVGYDSMRTRRVEEVVEIVKQAGFRKIKVVPEPLEIHPLVVATKT